MKNYIKKPIAAAWVGVISLFLASPVYALTINNAQDINDKILCKIFGWMFVFLITISAIMGLVGAFLYLTSGGDSEKVGRANKTLIYAVVGIVVALAARGIPRLINTLLGGVGIDDVCPLL